MDVQYKHKGIEFLTQDFINERSRFNPSLIRGYTTGQMRRQTDMHPSNIGGLSLRLYKRTSILWVIWSSM